MGRRMRYPLAAHSPTAPRPLPVRVPAGGPAPWHLGQPARGRRNVLELIPEIATRAPILSGPPGKRWHMVMDPEALKRILRDRVENYPKSVVTKLILEPAIGDSLFVAEGCRMALAAPHRGAGLFPSQRQRRWPR
jgi:hypothetical protein